MSALIWLKSASVVLGAGSADLSQARNGTPDLPRDPVTWGNGNAGPANSHFVEGYSVPYRLVCSDLTLGPHTVVIEWDTRANAKNAIDYLTHYQRLLPHDQFGAHTNAEHIQPLDGLAGPFTGPATFALPAPSGMGSSTPGQPTASFNALSTAERELVIWNGHIESVAFANEGNLSGTAAASQLAINFVADAPTVVLAWGGHIASKLDWGAGQSATAIGGSPYHMRLIGLDGSGGNQDRSLQAIAVVSPPTNSISGLDVICALTANPYAVETDAGTNAVFTWLLTNNTAGAQFAGPANGRTIQLTAAQGGTFGLQASVSVGDAIGTSLRQITVQAPLAVDPLADVNVCARETVTLRAVASGSGPLSFVWRKNGSLIPSAHDSTLSLSRVADDDAGEYCVEVTGPCNTVERCAVLTVDPPPSIVAPPDLAMECAAELPGPDPSLVVVLSGRPPVVVVPAGDVLTTNGNEVLVTRTYEATDACGRQAVATQHLLARDSTPPQIQCPGDLVLLENPTDSGQAMLNYTVPVATDQCAPPPAVSCTPPPGTSLPLGDTVVTCVATDAAGNTNACAFQVRVVPRIITVTSLADSGPGTLRQALLDANAALGSNTIQFDFPGQAPYTIHLLSDLPPIQDNLFIDGYSQLTFTGAPAVELNGSQVATNASPPPAGVQPGPASVGLSLSSSGAVVRGLVLNQFDIGIRIDGPGSNRIEGNFIGTDSTGTNRLGNRRDGILLTAGTSNNLIGPGNLIVFNGGNGITLDPSAGDGNSIVSNLIVLNGGIGIDLGDDGPTANDPADPDNGPNGLANSPILQDVRSDGFGITTLSGVLNGQANQSFVVEFFREEPANPDPLETQTLLGVATVTTDADGNASFSLSFAVGSRVGQFLTATATDEAHNTSEFGPRTAVRTPPIILVQPEDASVPLGVAISLCVTATGSEPLLYQWRRNGANIPGATNQCFSLAGVTLSDGGSYTVVVANDLGAIASDPAVVHLILPQSVIGDNFADRVPLLGSSGLISGTNIAATREPGEPNHAGKLGGRSVWYTWTAPADGIATVQTLGSTFDTLLGIYVGTNVGNLTVVGRDEDDGGYYTSLARFNADAGTAYQIAIDGFGGGFGDFVLSWQLEVTMDLLPVITNQPVSLTVGSGDSATFVVRAFGNCRDVDHDCRHRAEGHPGHPTPGLDITYQWYLNGTPIPGATDSTLTLTNVQDAQVGNYRALVNNGARFIFSDTAVLQINNTGFDVEPVQASDKFLDAVNASSPLRLGATGAGQGFVPAALARGYTGTQVFNTSGSLTEGEIICGVTGGASEWIPLVAEETGTIYLNTDGSSFDTVMAVFRRSPTNATKLDLIGCDNNSGVDGRDSALQLSVTAGQTNYIVVDGVNGVTGTLRLNYALVTPSSLTALNLSAQRSGRVRLSGHPAMRFTVQASTDLRGWTPLFTTNSSTAVFEFNDPGTSNATRRFYRAIMLP